MKKFKIVLIVLVLLLFMACSDGGDSHKHNFSQEWKKNGTIHWRECSCGEKSDEAAHIWGDWSELDENGDKTRSCTVCFLEENDHEHVYNRWASNEDYHWHECSCGAKSEDEEHDWQEVDSTEPLLREFVCECGRTETQEKYTDEEKAMGLHHDEGLEQGVIFARHRFADPSDTFAGTQSERLQLGAERFNEACEFMTQKVNHFGELLANDPAAQNFFGSSTDEVLNNTTKEMYLKNSSNVIDQYIAENNRNYAQYFAQMVVNILNDNEYNKFKRCYSKLAIRAYNDSLGALRNSTSFPTNQTDLPEVNQELVDAQVVTDGDTANYTAVETVLAGVLDNLAATHGMNPATLYAGVELALFNEGMWGLSDLGGHGIVTGDQVYKPPGYYTNTLSNRKRAIFMQEIVSIEYELTPIQT